MADTETNTQTEDGGRAAGRRAAAPAQAAGQAAAKTVEGERRAFQEADAAGRQASHEGMNAVRDLARNAADRTREMGEHSRDVTREAAGAWRSAAEPFIAMHMEMNRWFDEIWRHGLGLGALPALQTARPFLMSPAPMLGLPAADVMESDGAYKLCVEIPGLSDDDVSLQLRGGALVVSGQKTEDKGSAGAAFRISERRFGSFERSFPIPPDVDRDRIEAGVRDGVLTVTLPKSGQAGPAGRNIPVSRQG